MKTKVPARQEPQTGKKQLLCLVFALCVFSYIGGEIPSRLMVAKTDSVGYRLFYYERGQKAIETQKDQFVVFPLYADINKECNPCKVVKKIGCNEGEHLRSTREGYYYCGSKYLGKAKSHSQTGQPVEAFTYNGIVPPNKFFALGRNIHSYDSRYYGFIDKTKVEGIAYPLL